MRIYCRTPDDDTSYRLRWLVSLFSTAVPFWGQAITEDHIKHLIGPTVRTNTYIFTYFY